MDAVLEAFRRAHRAARVTSIEEAFGTLPSMHSHELAAHVGGWETHLMARALLVLRLRGAPEPGPAPDVVFGNMVNALKTCKEIPNDDPDPETRRKPAA
jgi:hypothetical protein